MRSIGATQSRRFSLSYTAPIAFALAPACYIGIAIYLYSVDLPQLEEWHQGLLHQKFTDGTLTFSDLFALQNEFRQFFPNVVFVVMGWLTKGDVRYPMYLSFLLACLISYHVYSLSGGTLRISPAQRWWLLVTANLLIFSPVQAENWLQGQQLIYFIPAAALTTCLHLAYSGNSRPYLKLFLCWLLSIISTFSSANGIAIWVLAVPALYWAPAWASLRHKSLWVCGWLASFALCLGFYLDGYRKPPNHPALSYVFAHPINTCLHWLSLLGGQFWLPRLFLTLASGALMLGLYLWASRVYLQHRKGDDHLAQSLLCWLILGAYALSSAAFITIGRAGFGPSQSLSTRYATFTVMLPVALVYLAAAAARGNMLPPFVLSARANPISIVVIAAIVVHVPIYAYGIRHMNALRSRVLHDKACVQLINVVGGNCQTRVFPDSAELRRFANTMDQLGYLRPPLAKSGSLRELAATGAQAPENYGSFIELGPSGTNQYTARGNARLPYRREAADAVLLACESTEHEAKVFAVAEVTAPGDFVLARLSRSVSDDGVWHKTFGAGALPTGACTVTAWAVDAYTGKAFKLSGAHEIVANLPTPPDH